LLGVSGLAAWSDGIGRAIFDNPGFPTITISTSGDFTSLTTNTSNNAYIPSGGGIIALVSTSKSYYPIAYASYSGTTITLAYENTITNGTYTVIPLQNLVCAGASLPLVTYSNVFGYSSWATGSISIYQNSINLSGQSNVIAAIGSFANQYCGPSVYASSAIPCLGFNSAPIDGSDVPLTGWAPFDGSNASNFYLSFGPVYAPTTLVDPSDSVKTYFAYVNYDDATSTPKTYFYQPISKTLHFSTSLNEDSITFDDTANTYSFNADGNTANGNIAGLRVALGTATVSSSVSMGITDSMTVNGTRRGVLNQLALTNATLTADRSLYAAQNVATLTSVQNSAAFSHNVYGAWNQATADEASGNSVDNEGNLYGAYNYGLHNTDNATFFRMEDVYGSYNYATSAGNTARIDDAFGVFARVNTSGTPASSNVAINRAYGLYSQITTSADREITTAYNLYLTSTEVGTITNKWGIYQANDWPNRFGGDVNLIGGLNLVPTVSVPTSGSTITLTSATTVLCLNHTATIATLTINFPSSPADGQCISICTRATVTNLTLGNGTFRGPITTISATTPAEYIYSSTGAAWFRKG